MKNTTMFRTPGHLMTGAIALSGMHAPKSGNADALPVRALPIRALSARELSTHALSARELSTHAQSACALSACAEARPRQRAAVARWLIDFGRSARERIPDPLIA